jgi:hypothetical protein
MPTHVTSDGSTTVTETEITDVVATTAISTPTKPRPSHRRFYCGKTCRQARGLLRKKRTVQVEIKENGNGNGVSSINPN